MAVTEVTPITTLEGVEQSDRSDSALEMEEVDPVEAEKRRKSALATIRFQIYKDILYNRRGHTPPGYVRFYTVVIYCTNSLQYLSFFNSIA